MQIELQGKPALMITAIDVTEIRQAEVELKESARILQTIINASNALVFLADTNGVLIASNDKFAMRMGIPPDAVAGISLYDILPEEVAMARKIPFEQVISKKKRIIYLDPREGIWFENSLNPILDESGKVVSVAVFARDISEQRRVTEALRASEEQYRTLAEASHDMIFTITRDDRISYVNSFGAKLVGSEPQQMVGQPRERFFPPETNQHQEEYIQRVIKSGQAISSESVNFIPAGSVWLNTWLVPLKDASGEVTSVLGVRVISPGVNSLKRLYSKPGINWRNELRNGPRNYRPARRNCVISPPKPSLPRKRNGASSHVNCTTRQARH